jgi:hypothetical protein
MNTSADVSKFKILPLTGSIKPSLQHFQYCRVGLSLGILYLSIFVWQEFD